MPIPFALSYVPNHKTTVTLAPETIYHNGMLRRDIVIMRTDSVRNLALFLLTTEGIDGAKSYNHADRQYSRIINTNKALAMIRGSPAPAILRMAPDGLEAAPQQRFSSCSGSGLGVHRLTATNMTLHKQNNHQPACYHAKLITSIKQVDYASLCGNITI